jgi:diguanylate cyclase (GGDEF)-like protein
MGCAIQHSGVEDPLQPQESTHQTAGEVGLVTRDFARRVGAQTAMFVRANGGDPDVVASWGAATGQQYLVGARDGFVRRALDLAGPVITDLDPRDASLGVSASGSRIRRAGGAPVITPSGWRGALCAGFASAPPVDPATELWLLDAYARLAALCLEDAGALGGLLVAARKDALTGCLNYATVREQLSSEVSRSSRHGLCLSCCFIDLDGFKHVNDLHGHLRGNRLLTNVACTLREGVRACDTLGRYGGDEFLAILPETDEAAARVLGDRLRRRISGATEFAADEPLGASVGVAQWHPGSSAEGLIEAADEALLVAKRIGGGVVVTESDVHPERAQA